jgi:hypothetical protein
VGCLLSPSIAAAADAFLSEIRLDRLDPGGSISPSSRQLCAGLGVLSQAAVGGGADVGMAGAMLSLLTKLDDQVIDARAFHEGLTREAAREKTRRYLAPTLASIRSGAPADDEERCVFAARLGRKLRSLGDCSQLIDTIARGWEVQATAVSTLTRHASEVTLEEVEAVTRDISGVWLLMIAEIGTIGARRFTEGERAAFLLWGDAIQKADALNDLPKDIADGHWSTYPLRLLYERAPEAYEAARGGADVDALLERHGIAAACFDASIVERAAAAHVALGELPLLLRWIHEHLTARWRARG